MDEYMDRLVPDGGWAAAKGQRINVPPPSKQGTLFRTASQLKTLFGRNDLPNIFPVINIHRRLFLPWLYFASQLMPFGGLKVPLREKIILRVAWNCRCRYEFAQHIELAQKARISDDEIFELTMPVAQINDPILAALMRTCDSLCNREPIPDDCWQQLAAKFKEWELIEILVLIGHYQMLAGILINTNVPLESAIEKNFQRFQAQLPRGSSLESTSSNQSDRAALEQA